MEGWMEGWMDDGKDRIRGVSRMLVQEGLGPKSPRQLKGGGGSGGMCHPDAEKFF